MYRTHPVDSGESTGQLYLHFEMFLKPREWASFAYKISIDSIILKLVNLCAQLFFGHCFERQTLECEICWRNSSQKRRIYVDLASLHYWSVAILLSRRHWNKYILKSVVWRTLVKFRKASVGHKQADLWSSHESLTTKQMQSMSVSFKCIKGWKEKYWNIFLGGKGRKVEKQKSNPEDASCSKYQT